MRMSWPTGGLLHQNKKNCINATIYQRYLIKNHKKKVPLSDALGKAETLVAKLSFLITWIEMII